ncbi:MAG: FMN-binding protein [Acidothermaceae bacterium]
MRRAIAALVATVAGLVILLSFKTASSKSPGPVALSGTAAGTDNSTSDPASEPAATPSEASSPAVTPSAAASSSASPPASASSKPSASTAKPASSSKTATGTDVSVSEGFRTFGSVQVKVTVLNGKITKLVAVDYPRDDPRSSEISQYSIPILQKEVLAAQGTSIDAISGATYTSEAYAQSVQAALDSMKS